MKEYECHIARDHAEHEGKSLCGYDIRMLFHFTSLDHWFNNRKMGGRLMGCPDCLNILQEALLEEIE
jgi:hypothetical protein